MCSQYGRKTTPLKCRWCRHDYVSAICCKCSFFLSLYLKSILFKEIYFKSHVHRATDGAIHEPKINYRSASYVSLFLKVRKKYYESAQHRTGRQQGTTFKRMTEMLRTQHGLVSTNEVQNGAQVNFHQTFSLIMHSL